MGFHIVLEYEDGEEIGSINDPTNIFHRLLPQNPDHQLHLARFIDWYGNTIFNRMQAATLMADWMVVSARAMSEEEKKLVKGVEELIEKLDSEPHLYLKFVGD